MQAKTRDCFAVGRSGVERVRTSINSCDSHLNVVFVLSEGALPVTVYIYTYILCIIVYIYIHIYICVNAGIIPYGYMATIWIDIWNHFVMVNTKPKLTING